MKKTISVILIFILVITGCSPAGDAGRGTKTVETGSFSLEVPSQARENKSMNEDAAVCYVNLIKGLYTMVIEEDKEIFAQMLPTEEMRRSGCIERLFRNNSVAFDTATGFIKVGQ